MILHREMKSVSSIFATRTALEEESGAKVRGIQEILLILRLLWCGEHIYSLLYPNWLARAWSSSFFSDQLPAEIILGGGIGTRNPGNPVDVAGTVGWVRLFMLSYFIIDEIVHCSKDVAIKSQPSTYKNENYIMLSIVYWIISVEKYRVSRK